MHDSGVRVADEAVASLLQSQHEALRPCEFHARENAIETRPTQVEIVNVRAVADDKAVRRSSLQFRDFLALHGQPDRETGADRAVDGLRRGGRPAARRGECAATSAASSKERLRVIILLMSLASFWGTELVTEPQIGQSDLRRPGL